MAENWIIEQTVEFTRPVQPYVGQPVELMLPGDHLAHTLRIKCKEKDMPVNLTGYTAAGYFKRTDGNTVLVVGSITGNVVDVTLSQECYAFAGNLRGVVRITNSTTNAKITLCDRLFHVGQSVDDGGTIDPGEVIPSLDDLLAEIDAMEQATAAAEAAAAAVPDMIAPTFSTSGAYASGDYVYYDGYLYRFTAAHAAGAWTGTDAVEVQLSPEVANLKSTIDAAPAIKDSTSSDIDLDVSDTAGNVILRLKDGHIKTKYFDSSNIIVPDMGLCYVAPNGSDTNNGQSASSPFATFQHALDAGYTKIIAAPGEYKNQRIVADGLNGVSIICNSNTTEATLFESHVRRTRAKIDNSIDVTGLTAYNSIYRTELTVDEDSSFYKVFISQTLDPVYSGAGYYGRVTTYNVILWEITSGIAGCTRLVPKLTLEECEATTGTFFYDGDYIYINPTGGTLGTKTYKRLNFDTNQYGVDIRNSTDIYMQGIDVAFFPYYDLYFAHCEKVMVRDCCCTFTSYGSAFEIAGGDTTFVSCTAAKAGADGFGIATYGDSSFYDCNALYCYDDGISHHDAATGVIDGGQWIGCLKGGVTPSYGSNVTVKNVYCSGNLYGIYWTQSGDRVTDVPMRMLNCVSVGNATNSTARDIKITGYDIISGGCVYGTKTVDSGASLTEYGNTVIS